MSSLEPEHLKSPVPSPVSAEEIEKYRKLVNEIDRIRDVEDIKLSKACKRCGTSKENYILIKRMLEDITGEHAPSDASVSPVEKPELEPILIKDTIDIRKKINKQNKKKNKRAPRIQVPLSDDVYEYLQAQGKKYVMPMSSICTKIITDYIEAEKLKNKDMPETVIEPGDRDHKRAKKPT
jgi:hypothetical protein